MSVADEKGLKILLERGVDANEVGKYENRPLHILADSASSNEIEKVIGCAKLLLDAKASVIRKNMMGETALIIAVRKGYNDVVNILMESGANAKLVDNYKKNALAYASEKGFTEITEILIPFSFK